MTHVVWAPAGVARRRPQGARRARRAPSCPDDPARPAQPRGAARVNARVDVRDFDVAGRPRGAVGGDRASAARRRGPSSRLARPAAADLGPAGVLPLAGRAALGLHGARRARLGVRPARRRLVRVARAAAPLRAARRALRRDRRLRPRLAARASLAGGARRALAGDPPVPQHLVVEGPGGRRRAARGLAAVAAAPPDPAHPPTRRRARGGRSVDGEPVSAPGRCRPAASELLSAELDTVARDPIYEAAVRAVSRATSSSAAWRWPFDETALPPSIRGLAGEVA